MRGKDSSILRAKIYIYVTARLLPGFARLGADECVRPYVSMDGRGRPSPHLQGLDFG